MLSPNGLASLSFCDSSARAVAAAPMTSANATSMDFVLIGTSFPGSARASECFGRAKPAIHGFRGFGGSSYDSARKPRVEVPCDRQSLRGRKIDKAPRGAHLHRGGRAR